MDLSITPEIPKYKKKSDKKGKSRANHKHIYKKAVLRRPHFCKQIEGWAYEPISICEICGYNCGDGEKAWGKEFMDKWYYGEHFYNLDKERIKGEKLWDNGLYEKYETTDLWDKFPKKVEE